MTRVVSGPCCVKLRPARKVQIRLPPARPALSRFTPDAALSLVLGAGFLLAPFLKGQQPDPQQAPAPVVRVRPRPASAVPANAPPDAAPLVNRTPRPRPINPQELGGATASTGQISATTPRPRPAQTSPAAQRTPAAGGTGPVAPTRIPRTAASPSTTGSTAPGSTAAANISAKPPTLSTTGLNRSVIVLDPAHGGADSGSRIGDNTLEKNVTLALAFRLRSLLTARGFTVVLTRDSDAALETTAAGAPLTLDDRAGIANHARAAACLLLHATGRGNGLHLYTSELDPAPGEATQLPWLTAQAAWIPASEQFERSVSSALGRSHIALVSSTASIRPVDSLACPALVVELAPENGDVGSVNDASYQERVAAAVAGALVFWQNQVQAPPKLTLVPPATRTPRHHVVTPSSATSTEPKP